MSMLHVKITGKGFNQQLDELFWGKKATKETKGLEKHARKRISKHTPGIHPYPGYQKKSRKTGRKRYY